VTASDSIQLRSEANTVTEAVFSGYKGFLFRCGPSVREAASLLTIVPGRQPVNLRRITEPVQVGVWGRPDGGTMDACRWKPRIW
jgi:hypothetical protein